MSRLKLSRTQPLPRIEGMQRKSKRVRFPNSLGVSLSGILELPQESPRAHVIFSHCFTCTKDLKAIVRISRRLAEQGLAVLRFDFTGLGESSGDFSQTTFENNIDDLLAAARFLENEYSAPQILIGHSLGGAASVVAAPRISSARCVVNIASPASTSHLAEFLLKENPNIGESGIGDVVIGGYTHSIRMPMITALQQHDHPKELQELKLPLLVMFSPADETLSFEHGREIFALAGGPASFVTIDGADHLFTNQPQDINFVADIISTWSRRFLF